MANIDIGKEKETIVVEPVEDPFKRDVPAESPAEPVKVPEPEKVPAGV